MAKFSKETNEVMEFPVIDRPIKRPRGLPR